MYSKANLGFCKTSNEKFLWKWWTAFDCKRLLIALNCLSAIIDVSQAFKYSSAFYSKDTRMTSIIFRDLEWFYFYQMKLPFRFQKTQSFLFSNTNSQLN